MRGTWYTWLPTMPAFSSSPQEPPKSPVYTHGIHACKPPHPSHFRCTRCVNKAPAHLTFGVTGSHGRFLYQPPVVVPAVFTSSARFKALEGLVTPIIQQPLSSRRQQKAPSDGVTQAVEWMVGEWVPWACPCWPCTWA